MDQPAPKTCQQPRLRNMTELSDGSAPRSSTLHLGEQMRLSCDALLLHYFP